MINKIKIIDIIFFIICVIVLAWIRLQMFSLYGNLIALTVVTAITFVFPILIGYYILNKNHNKLSLAIPLVVHSIDPVAFLLVAGINIENIEWIKEYLLYKSIPTLVIEYLLIIFHRYVKNSKNRVSGV